MTAASQDRDVPLVAARLVTLWSAFYLFGGITLQILRALYDILPVGWRGTFPGVDDDARRRAETMAFSTVRSVAWMGLLLPSLVYTLLQRFMVIVCFSLSASVVIESFRSVVDYIASVYLLHVLCTMAVFGIPHEAAWWAAVAAECAVMVTVAEILVARRQRGVMVRLVRRIEGNAEEDAEAV